MKDGIHLYGEFDTDTHEMECGITSPDGFTTYVMRDREHGSYTVEVRLDRDWIKFCDEQEALGDYLKISGICDVFSGAWFVDNYQTYWVCKTDDEELAWDLAFGVDMLIKVEQKPWN